MNCFSLKCGFIVNYSIVIVFYRYVISVDSFAAYAYSKKKKKRKAKTCLFASRLGYAYMGFIDKSMARSSAHPYVIGYFDALILFPKGGKRLLKY